METGLRNRIYCLRFYHKIMLQIGLIDKPVRVNVHRNRGRMKRNLHRAEVVEVNLYTIVTRAGLKVVEGCPLHHCLPGVKLFYYVEAELVHHICEVTTGLGLGYGACLDSAIADMYSNLAKRPGEIFGLIKKYKLG